jgi:predicted molibdopterin-dependent oxidoreductase YjgC
MEEGRVGYVICGYCSCGCGFYMDPGERGPVGVIPANSHPVSGGRLCRRGWTIYQPLRDPSRIRSPLVRSPSGWDEVGWGEAISMIAERLGSLDPGEIGVIASPNSPNESLFLLSKLSRSVFRTKNLDFMGRYFVDPLPRYILSDDELLCTFDDVSDSDLILCIGVGDGDVAPQLVPRIWKAIGRGSKIVSIDGWTTDLFSEAVVLTPMPHTDFAWIEALCSSISPSFIPSRSYKEASDICGIEADRLEMVGGLVSEARRVAVIWNTLSLGRTADSRSALALAKLLRLLKDEKDWVGFLPIFGRCNTLGALDMGIAPDFHPGHRPGEERGLDLMGMVKGALDGSIKSLLLFGDLLGWELSHREWIEKGLGSLQFLVVFASFPSQTTELAHVVLPRPLPGEVDGTYTNCEGRVQRTAPAVRTGIKQEWEAIVDLARAMGASWSYDGIEGVRGEIADLIPEYSEIRSPKAYFMRRFGKRVVEEGVIQEAVPTPSPDRDHPFILCVERVYLYNFDPDILRSPIMRRELKILPQDPHVLVNPADGREMAVRDGSRAVISSHKGEGTFVISYRQEVPTGKIILPDVFYDLARDILGDPVTDPVTGRILLPAAAVSIKPAR